MTKSRRRRPAVIVTTILVFALVVAGTTSGCAPPPTRPPYSGTTCWAKRAFYQARNPGLKETLGSGTIYTTPCVLSAYLAIERAAVEFGVPQFTDALIRIAACESLLQPTILGRRDASDVGLFQWNDKPPRYWWSTARNLFNAWQRAKVWASRGRYVPRFATNDRLDPYNSARVAAWEIVAFPHSWGMTWLCKGTYNPATGRLH